MLILFHIAIITEALRKTFGNFAFKV